MPQPSLLEGLSLICADPVALRGSSPPLKLSAQAFIAGHDIVKGENDGRVKMFLFFPECLGLSDRIQPSA